MDWLRQHKLANIIIALIYYLGVVLPHEQVGKAINGFFNDYSRSTYNTIIAVLVVLLAGLMIYFLYPSLKLHKERPKLIIYVTVSALLVLLCFNILFVINVEAIHFVQYGLLAILLFPLTKNASSTISIAVFAGALDELYQYLILATTNHYYDFNDVLLDTIGAGLGLLVLKILGVETHVAAGRKWYWKTGYVLSLAVAILLLISGLMGHFSINPVIDDPAYFTLFKRAPNGFWHFPAGPYARFHILRPISGLIIIYSVSLFYSRLDRVKPWS